MQFPNILMQRAVRGQDIYALAAQALEGRQGMVLNGR